MAGHIPLSQGLGQAIHRVTLGNAGQRRRLGHRAGLAGGQGVASGAHAFGQLASAGLRVVRTDAKPRHRQETKGRHGQHNPGQQADDVGFHGDTSEPWGVRRAAGG